MFDLVKLRWWFRCQPSLSLLVMLAGYCADYLDMVLWVGFGLSH